MASDASFDWLIGRRFTLSLFLLFAGIELFRRFRSGGSQSRTPSLGFISILNVVFFLLQTIASECFVSLPLYSFYSFILARAWSWEIPWLPPPLNAAALMSSGNLGIFFLFFQESKRMCVSVLLFFASTNPLVQGSQSPLAPFLISSCCIASSFVLLLLFSDVCGLLFFFCFLSCVSMYSYQLSSRFWWLTVAGPGLVLTGSVGCKRNTKWPRQLLHGTSILSLFLDSVENSAGGHMEKSRELLKPGASL